MTCFGSCVTAIALGSSTGFGAELLSDSLRFSGQIRLGPAKGSVEGSTKVAEVS